MKNLEWKDIFEMLLGFLSLDKFLLLVDIIISVQEMISMKLNKKESIVNLLRRIRKDTLYISAVYFPAYIFQVWVGYVVLIEGIFVFLYSWVINGTGEKREEGIKYTIIGCVLTLLERKGEI